MERSLIQEYPNVFISRGIAIGTPDSFQPHPSLIIIFGWMDAQVHLLAKYVSMYRQHLGYTRTTIVVVQSQSSFLYSSQVKRERILSPVVDLLMEKVYGENPCTGLILHILSNGGGFQVMMLARMLKNRLLLSEKAYLLSVPPIAIILDSVPGANDYSSMIRTFTAHVHTPLVKLLLRGPLTLVYIIYFVVNYGLMLNERLIPALHKHLRQPAIIPQPSDICAPRLYIYSDSDQMVPCDAVERHLDVLNKDGLTLVMTEKYHGSDHVSHMKADSDRYWSAVEEVWNVAVQNARERSKL